MRYHDLPPAAAALVLALHFAAGFGVGALHFRALWWQAQRLAGGARGRPILLAVIGRFGVLGALLLLAALEGALPLLVAALGILAARAVVVRRLGARLP